MDDILQRMLSVEREAERIVQEAEAEATQIAQQARRDAAQLEAQLQAEIAEAVLAHVRERVSAAEAEKERALAEAEVELRQREQTLRTGHEAARKLVTAALGYPAAADASG